MIGLPTHLAFLIGVMTGLLGYGPVNRWWSSLRRELVAQAERPEAQHKDSRKLLFIFATLHPAPWLFILGVPFALYQLLFGPLPRMWLWLTVGVMLGVALMFFYAARIAGRARS
jgi:hypothetical protein